MFGTTCIQALLRFLSLHTFSDNKCPVPSCTQVIGSEPPCIHFLSSHTSLSITVDDCVTSLINCSEDIFIFGKYMPSLLKIPGKPRATNYQSINHLPDGRGEGGVGSLVCECLVSEVEFITRVTSEESVWVKVWGEKGRLALYIGCVYMPTDSTSVAVLDTCYERHNTLHAVGSYMVLMNN